MTDTSTERESTWTRLRRRKVVQWGVVYVAAAWGFLQGLEYLSGTYDWPRQIQQLTTLVLLIGLPIVLVLAWYHGDRGQQRITTPEFAILTLLLLLGGGAFWYYQRTNETHKAPSTAVQPAAPAAPLEAAAAPDAKSIAVLPFVDMSAAKDQEYMSDGITEELLNLLAEVPDLKVIARTSSFAFKGEKIEVAEIAKRLNVAHVLEGSVRRSGNKLRITAQLIRTADSTHLWSKTYGKDLTGEPLLKRRTRLARVLDGSGLLPSPELPGTVEAIVDAVRGLGLEGVIAKRKDSLYEPGERSDAWQKLKLENQQEFVIGGYRPGSNGVDALLVGHYDESGLRFGGKVRAGFVPHLRRQVFKTLKPHHVDQCPFVDLPNSKFSRWGGGVTAEEMREMQWVTPELVAQIRFVEWTAEGRLRHAAFLGLRSEVRRECLHGELLTRPRLVD